MYSTKCVRQKQWICSHKTLAGAKCERNISGGTMQCSQIWRANGILSDSFCDVVAVFVAVIPFFFCSLLLYFYFYFDRAFLQHKDGGTILSGYRVGLGYKGNCKSIFRIHNETMNIWSHLLGALFFVYLTVDLQNQISSPLLRDSLHDIVYAGQPFVHGKDMCFQNTSAIRAYMHRLNAEMDLVDPSWWINATSIVRTTCIATMEYKSPLRTIVGNAQTQHKLANMDEQVVNPLRNEFYNTITGLVAACHSLSKKFLAKANAQQNMSPLTNKLQNASHYMRDMGDMLQQQLSLALAEQVEKMLPAAPLGAIADSRSIQVLRALAIRIHQSLGAIEIDLKKDMTDLQIASQFIDLPFWPTFIFLASAIVCMSFSALFHLLNPISASAYKKFQKLDYAGISFLIAGSTVPIIYYSFRCSSTLKSVFLFFDIGLNSACMVVIMLPCSRKHSPAMQVKCPKIDIN